MASKATIKRSFSLPEVAQTEEGPEILRTVCGLYHDEDYLNSINI